MKALYGFSADLPPFAGQSPQAQAALLHTWGADSVFGGYTNPAFVDAIHNQGLKIYAEFGCFQGKQWWDTVPECRPTLANGTLLDPIDWYHGVNPSVPTVREQLLERLATLLTDHEIDGVWLDFIRWPCRWEHAAPELLHTSFDRATIARFAGDSGLDTPLHWQEDVTQNASLDYTNKYIQLWTSWRTAQITSWVAAAKEVIATVRPTATLGLFAIPWRQSDFSGAIQTIIGQDFMALAPHIDIFSPMTYHQMCGQPVPWIGEVVQELRQLTGKAVVPVIQSVDQPTKLSSMKYQAALQQAATEADGTIVFTLAGLLTDDKLGVTQELWQEGGYLSKINDTGSR